MDRPHGKIYPAQGPSLRSEFGSVGIPADGELRIGGREPVRDSAKRYQFSRYETPPEKSAPTSEPVTVQPVTVQPVVQQAIPVQPVIQQAVPIQNGTQQTVTGQTVWPVGTEFRIPPVQNAQPAYVVQPPVPPEQPRESVPRSAGPWIAVAVIAALLLGIVIGAFGYQLWLDYGHRLTNASPIASQTVPDTTPSDAPAMKPSEIYKRCSPSVVGITAVGFATSSPESSLMITVPVAGTGFLITENGYLLTNYHVVRNASELNVTLFDGREYKARLVAYEEKSSDLALLKIDADGLQPVVIGDSSALHVGDQVCTVGNPFGELGYSLTVGYISYLEREISADGASIRVLQTDVAINSGSSGGPLFDGEGLVAGIVTAKYSGGSDPDAAAIEGLGFAIPINDAMVFVNGWMQEENQAGNP